ncbi:MAG: hypothetical protein FWF56_06630 [Firmicutes bacterium]|nr:hypothetical protein [Bacillota bacterium]MCL1953122.1 hypothetical protein [Bacillota bacterium]
MPINEDIKLNENLSKVLEHDRLQLVEQKIGYKFDDMQLLLTAFTAPSYANDHLVESYDRLEHLGDSILGFCICEYLYFKFPTEKVEKLNDERQGIVAQKPLSQSFDRLDISQFVMLSKNQALTESIKADIVEALIGAIYLDSKNKSGLNIVSDWIIANTLAT